MDRGKLKEIRDEFLYSIAVLLTEEGVVCFKHDREPVLAYLADDTLIGRHYVQAIRRPPGFAPAPCLFRIVLNLSDNMPSELNMTNITSRMGAHFRGFSDRQGFKLICTPEEMKAAAPFVSMRIMCDARPEDLPIVLCPFATCTPLMSKEIWTVDAFKADEKACLLALNEIADKDDPLA